MRTALTIASSDSGGGAGIQADLKAFARCGVHGTSAIVALTAQNTTGVSEIFELPASFVAAQIEAVLSDIGADAVKTGMLFSATLINVVASALAGRAVPLVVDPVMVASSGARLLQPDAVSVLIGRLFPLATVVTPNLPEAQALTGLDTEDRGKLAERLVPAAVASDCRPHDCKGERDGHHELKHDQRIHKASAQQQGREPDNTDRLDCDH